MPSRDLPRSRAVLIGTWDYQHLPQVPAARNSLMRMRALLTGELCGWPEDRVTVIGNRASPGDLHGQLIELFSDTDPDGVALFYYVGHGQPDDQDRLCFGLMGSRTDHLRRASTSLRFDDVRGALVACEARTKIVMLDCCFAGLAARPRQSLSGEDVLDMVRGAGAYTMAASGAYLPAWFETDAPAPQTYFTKYFVDVVESGIAGEPPGLTLDRVFAETHVRLGRDGKPEPTHTARHQAGRTVFARNAAPVEQQVDREAEIARLRAELAEARREAEELRARDLANELLMRERSRLDKMAPGGSPSDKLPVLGPAERAASASASRAAAADARQAEKAKALRELDTPVAEQAHEPVAEIVVKLASASFREGPDGEKRVHALLTTAARRPTGEIAELVARLPNQHDDVKTIMRWAALRPVPDIVDLAVRLGVGRTSGYGNYGDPLWWLLHWLGARPVEERVEVLVALRAAGQDQAADSLAAQLAHTKGEDAILVVDALRANNQADSARKLLRAGGRSMGLVDLIGLLGQENRTGDLLEVAAATRRMDREDRKLLESRFLRGTVPEATWRPLLKPFPLRDQITDPTFRDRWLERWETLARYVLYPPLTFLLGMALSHGGALSFFGWVRLVVSVAVFAVLAWGLRALVTDRDWMAIWLGERLPLNVTLLAALVLGFVSGFLFETVGVAMRAVLTWGF
jgi:hypothetical protein